MKNSAQATTSTGREGRKKEGRICDVVSCLTFSTYVPWSLYYTLLLTLVNPNFISVLHETVAHRNVLWMMDRFRARAIVSN